MLPEVTMSRWDTFDRIWVKGKNGKMRMRLMAKCTQRGIEPNEENCRDYWMGYIRFYKDAYSGNTYHINPRKHKSIMKSLRRSKNETGRRRQNSKGKPYNVATNYKKKKRSI